MANQDSVYEVIEHLYSILKVCGVEDREISRTFEDVSKALSLDTARAPRVLAVTSRLHIDATSVVATWRRNEQFLDGEGEPISLSTSDDQNGFGALVAKSRVNSSPSEVLAYLVDLEIVTIGQPGLCELREESVLVTAGDSAMPGPGVVAPDVTIGHVSDFLRTVRNNLSDGDTKKPRNFERACYGRVNESLIPVFRRLVKERGQQYVDSIDEWLDRHPPDEKSRKVLVGSGAYGILDSKLYE